MNTFTRLWILLSLCTMLVACNSSAIGSWSGTYCFQQECRTITHDIDSGDPQDCPQTFRVKVGQVGNIAIYRTYTFSKDCNVTINH